MKIGSKVGNPIKVDMNTSLVNRGHYVRMCVEVDMSKPLLWKFRLKRRTRRIEYEDLHLVCFECGKYGYMQSYCTSVKQAGESGESQTIPHMPVNGINQGKDLPKNREINSAVVENYGD